MKPNTESPSNSPVTFEPTFAPQCTDVFVCDELTIRDAVVFSGEYFKKAPSTDGYETANSEFALRYSSDSGTWVFVDIQGKGNGIAILVVANNDDVPPSEQKW